MSQPTVDNAKEKLKIFFQSLLWSGSETSEFGKSIAECVDYFWTRTDEYHESSNYATITWTAKPMSDNEAFRILKEIMPPLLDKARQSLNVQAYPGQAQQGQYRPDFEALCTFISQVVATLEARGGPAVGMPHTENGRDDLRKLLDELEQLIKRWRV